VDIAGLACMSQYEHLVVDIVVCVDFRLGKVYSFDFFLNPFVFSCSYKKNDTRKCIYCHCMYITAE
jgi:hypothetical protein